MTLRNNLVANYIGQTWSALMGFAFVPIYVKYLGMEAYGLIGVFALLQAWLALLDMGLSPALGREMARYRGGAHTENSIRDLLRSVEVVGCGLAGIFTLCLWGGSTWIAANWLMVDQLPLESVAQALSIMGVVTSLRIIENIYRSAIVGLQRQVTLNLAGSVMATLRSAGAVGVLAFVSPSIGAFFVWQGIVSVLTLVLYVVVVYGHLEARPGRGKFNVAALKGVREFASGVAGIAFLTLLLTQTDKVLLSRLLSLAEFGQYSLAATVAGALYMLVGPIAQAFFPRFSELAVQNDGATVQLQITTFHQGCQLVTVALGSAAVVLIGFSDDILHLWTGNVGLANGVSPLVKVLALGTLLNGLMYLPAQMQLAHGWTSLTVKTNLVAVMMLVPAIWIAVPLYGAIGAAWVWVVLNAGYILISIHFMFRKLLSGEKWKWYIYDVGVPLSVAAGVSALARLTNIGTLNVAMQIVVLVLISVTVLFLTAMSASHVRRQLLRYLQASYRSCAGG